MTGVKFSKQEELNFHLLDEKIIDLIQSINHVVEDLDNLAVV